MLDNFKKNFSWKALSKTEIKNIISAYPCHESHEKFLAVFASLRFRKNI
jgi:hypothetical protein